MNNSDSDYMKEDASDKIVRDLQYSFTSNNSEDEMAFVKFQVFMAASLKMAGFWDEVLCSLVEEN
jgi:hypothetical protein